MRRKGKGLVQNGKVFPTNGSGDLVILSHEGKYAAVRFSNTGHQARAKKSDIVLGKVKDVSAKSILGVAAIGVGEYTAASHPSNYSRWFDMIKRCEHGHTNYKGCTVVDSWYIFQNYMMWAITQTGHDNCDWELDKDLGGGALYSPSTCTFLPKPINRALISHRLKAGSRYKTGVSYNKSLGKFIARAKQASKLKSTYLGLYLTEEDAYSSYCEAKVAYLRYLTNKYKEVLSSEVYTKLMQWKVPEYLKSLK